MRLAVLRASGTAFDPVSFLAGHSLAAEAGWRAGEPDRKGRPRPESGFNLLVAEQDDEATFLAAVGNFLRDRQAMLSALAVQGAATELDIGLTVGSDVHFTASIALTPQLLAELAKARIGLRVSAYPSSG